MARSCGSTWAGLDLDNGSREEAAQLGPCEAGRLSRQARGWGACRRRISIRRPWARDSATTQNERRCCDLLDEKKRGLTEGLEGEDCDEGKVEELEVDLLGASVVQVKFPVVRGRGWATRHADAPGRGHGRRWPTQTSRRWKRAKARHAMD